MVYYGTEVSALNFGIKRSQFKVSVEKCVLEPSLHRCAVLDISCRVRLSSISWSGIFVGTKIQKILSPDQLLWCDRDARSMLLSVFSRMIPTRWSLSWNWKRLHRKRTQTSEAWTSRYKRSRLSFVLAVVIIFTIQLVHCFRSWCKVSKMTGAWAEHLKSVRAIQSEASFSVCNFKYLSLPKRHICAWVDQCSSDWFYTRIVLSLIATSGTLDFGEWCKVSKTGQAWDFSRKMRRKQENAPAELWMG